MKAPYPELKDTIERVQKGIKAEETTFFGTVGAGLNRINKMFDEMRARRPRDRAWPRRGRALHDLRRAARNGREAWPPS